MITQTQTRARVTPRSRGFEWGGLLRGYWIPAVITALVLAGALLGPSALTTGGMGAPAQGVRLEVGWGYLAMAPVANVLDTLSVLTLGQHYAVLVTLILLYVGWRLVRSRRRRGVVRRVGVELGAAALALLGLAAFYGYGIIGPRPMAALVPTDDDVVVVDVHSHTHHSHDGRRGFDAEDRRAWHAAAGFDAVYVTDHRTFDGYFEGARNNPARAGEGTVLLPGLEIKFAGKYASALGPPSHYERAMQGNHLNEDSVVRLLREQGIRPTLVLTLPSGLDGLVVSTATSPGYIALELSDASPRGLRQSRRDRERLLRMADSLDLAPVAATNNHGWGRTAAAWTLMRIPDWQRLTPEQLATAIETRLHRERRAATWVVERRVPYAGEDAVSLAGTVPAITWNMFGAMTPAERVSWLAWIWLITFVVAAGLTPGWPRLAQIRKRHERS